MSKKTTTIVEKYNDEGKLIEKITTTVEEDIDDINNINYIPFTTPDTTPQVPPDYTIPKITCVDGKQTSINIGSDCTYTKTDAYSTKNV